MVDTIYAEDEIIGTKKAQEIISKFKHAKVISIKKFGEVFNPSNQNFRIQKIPLQLIGHPILRSVELRHEKK